MDLGTRIKSEMFLNYNFQKELTTVTKERYEKIARWMTARPALLLLTKALNRWLPIFVYCAYPLLLILLAVERDVRFYRVLIVPAIVYCSVTVLRKCLNFPRPYEKLSITPLISREGAGQSFPSRHASSVTIIAAAFWYIWPPAGIALSVIALIIAVIRPVAGIHFPRDVIAGVIYSIVIGTIGFYGIR